jgi:hypothetical protein
MNGSFTFSSAQRGSKYLEFIEGVLKKLPVSLTQQASTRPGHPRRPEFQAVRRADI